MLRKVRSFELSSGGLSDAYAASSDAVFASLAEAKDCGVVVPDDGVAMMKKESFHDDENKSAGQRTGAVVEVIQV